MDQEGKSYGVQVCSSVRNNRHIISNKDPKDFYQTFKPKQPVKIFCIGRNYAKHARELGNELPEEPVIFMKPPTALLVNDKAFYYPEFSQDVHYEIELVLRICKNGKSVQREFAHRYYDRIGLGIDFTARDLQSKQKAKGLPWEIAKGFDSSAVISEFVSLDRFDKNNIRFQLEKNGEVVQDGTTADLLFPFDDLIVHLSRYFKLNMGDLIYTGTPEGVGPVAVGDTLAGYLETPTGRERMFICEVK